MSKLFRMSLIPFLLMNADPGAGGSAGAPGGAPATPPSTPPATPPSDWTSGFNDELKGFVANKGFKDPGMVLESYRGLEKLLGAPKERLMLFPEKADDVEGYNAIYKRLGRPEKAEDYKFTLKPEAGDEKFVSSLKNKFHEFGISSTQAEKIMGWYQEHFDGQVNEVSQQMVTKSNTEKANLQKEWGGAFEQNSLIAKKAVEAFGITPEAIDALQDTMGYDGVHKLLHSIGSKIGEDSFVSNNSGAGGGFKGAVLTPSQAQAAINEKMADQAFGARLLAKDPEAMAEWERLNIWASAAPSA
jgi:hypothetical protein